MRVLLFLILSALTATNAQAATFNFDTTGSEPLYQTSLTKEVYQASRRDDLQDLTIHNATGEQLPYALIPYEVLHPTQMVEESKPLVIFPMQKAGSQPINDINIHLEQSTGKTTIDVNGNHKQLAQKTAYLFDLGKDHPTLKKLKVDWQGEEGKLIAVEAFSSNNLKDWSNIGQSVLFKSVSAGQTILQNTIELYAFTQDRYLQLRPADVSGLDFKLTAVSTEYSKVQSLPLPQLWQTLVLLKREHASNDIINIDFESPARYPASYLRINLPQQNTITSVQVLTRNQSDAPWAMLINAPLYRVNKQGRDTVNPDIKLNPKVARYWRLQFNQANGGIGSENPALSVGWLAKTVVWNARGKAPYTLQIGKSSGTVNATLISNLIPDYSAEKIDALPVANLNLINNSTETAQSSWITAPDYKSWLLWAGLALGVLLLAAMAYSLLKTERNK
jgi:hypothetical protein